MKKYIQEKQRKNQSELNKLPLSKSKQTKRKPITIEHVNIKKSAVQDELSVDLLCLLISNRQ